MMEVVCILDVNRWNDGDRVLLGVNRWDDGGRVLMGVNRWDSCVTGCK